MRTNIQLMKTNLNFVIKCVKLAKGRDIEWSRTENKKDESVTFRFYCEQYTFQVWMLEELVNVTLVKRTEDNPMGKSYHPQKWEGMMGEKIKDFRKFAKIFFSYVPLAI